MTMDEIHRWHGYSSTDSLLPLCRYCNPRWEDLDDIALDPDFDLNPPVDRQTAINYSLAGRADPSHSFKDFRSSSKARRRHRERNEKYYSWRAVKPGQLDRPHYTPNDGWVGWYITPLPEAPVATMSKQRLYREAQMWPRPPKLHRSTPWEKAPCGAADCHSGPKHARQRLAAESEEAVDIELDLGVWRLLRDDAVKENGCAGACANCLLKRYALWREMEEQEGIGAASSNTDFDGESGDEDWDLLSTPSSAAAYSDGEESWAMVPADPESDDEWILAPSAPPPLSPSIQHSSPPAPLATNLTRCTACLSDDLAQWRLSHYTHARLSDIALLRGRPSGATISCVPFHQLLPFLVESGAGEEEPDAVSIVQAARGPLAGEWYAGDGEDVVNLGRGFVVAMGDVPASPES